MKNGWFTLLNSYVKILIHGVLDTVQIHYHSDRPLGSLRSIHYAQLRFNGNYLSPAIDPVRLPSRTCLAYTLLESNLLHNVK